jgi:hypothetical protein
VPTVLHCREGSAQQSCTAGKVVPNSPTLQGRSCEAVLHCREGSAQQSYTAGKVVPTVLHCREGRAKQCYTAGKVVRSSATLQGR